MARVKLIVLALLLALIAGLVAREWLFVPAARTPPALDPDTAQLAPFVQSSSLSLGMSTEPSDILDPAVLQGATLAPAARAAGLAILRFGDIDADNYDWQTGCIYPNDARLHPQCIDPVHGFGSFDRFLRLAGAIDARPLIVVDGQIDDPQQAARQVAYYQLHCAALMAVERCPEPYWEIGSSPATWRHFAIPLSMRRPDDTSAIQPDQYAALVSSYASAMGQVDRQVRIVADEWIVGATDQSWVASVVAVDTHYAPLLYASSESPASDAQIVASVRQGSPGRLGLDDWLHDLRTNLAQFSNSGGVGIIVGRWSIDANIDSNQPPRYGGYVQALFTAVMLAHLWQDAAPGSANPVLMAVQYPIIGTGQEPFDVVSGQPHPAVSVYSLLHRYFGVSPAHLTLGLRLQRDGIVGAASYAHAGLASILLVNTSQRHSRTVRLQDLPVGAARSWCIVPDAGQAIGVPATQEVRPTNAGSLALPPRAICVVQVGR